MVILTLYIRTEENTIVTRVYRYKDLEDVTAMERAEAMLNMMEDIYDIVESTIEEVK